MKGAFFSFSAVDTVSFGILSVSFWLILLSSSSFHPHICVRPASVTARAVPPQPPQPLSLGALRSHRHQFGAVRGRAVLCPRVWTGHYGSRSTACRGPAQGVTRPHVHEARAGVPGRWPEQVDPQPGQLCREARRAQSHRALGQAHEDRPACPATTAIPPVSTQLFNSSLFSHTPV